MRANFWRQHEVSLLVSILVVALVTLALDAQHNYWINPRASGIDLLRQWSMLGLFSLGSAIVIISGGIDLSTGSVIAFSGTICATLLLILAPEAMTRSLPLPTWVVVTAIAGTLLSGFLIGSLHAWLIIRVGLPPFVATLATLVGLRSLARAVCESVTQAILGGSSTQIGIYDQNFRYLATSVWIPAALLAAISIFLWLFLGRSIFGRHLYALGGNEQAARLSGIATDRLKWLAYCISAILASIAGIFYICEQSVADPQTLGRGYELNAIAAAVVGGCSLQGGVGTVPGTLLGALFLRAVIDGVSKIIKTGADVYEGLIVGVVVVVAVVFTRGEAIIDRRRHLFSGPLGLITILNLTGMAALLMALVGSRLLGAYVQMNAAWLSWLTAGCTFPWLLLFRWNLGPLKRRRALAALAVLTVSAIIIADRSYPAVQRHWAIQAIEAIGGHVEIKAKGTGVEMESVTTVDLSQAKIDDREWKRLHSKLKFLQPISRLELSGENINERSLESLQDWPHLKEVKIYRTALSTGAIRRLQRSLPETSIQIVP